MYTLYTGQNPDKFLNITCERNDPNVFNFDNKVLNFWKCSTNKRSFIEKSLNKTRVGFLGKIILFFYKYIQQYQNIHKLINDI